MGVICFVCGAMFGGLVGTVTMCLVQVGRENKKDSSRLDEPTPKS